MKDKSTNWQDSDYILLQAIYNYNSTTLGNESNLQEIISLIDYCNFSIITFDDFIDGLSKLITVDYVKLDNQVINLSDLFWKEHDALILSSTLENPSMDWNRSNEKSFLMKLLNTKDFPDSINYLSEDWLTLDIYQREIIAYKKTYETPKVKKSSNSIIRFLFPFIK